jgi:hypothetical protein
VELAGEAQFPRSRPWKVNPEGPRTIDQAVTLARRQGVVIPEDVELVVDEWGLITEPDVDARYFRWRGQPTDFIPWTAFYSARGKIPVLVRPEVLASDEAIVAVFAHEVYELNQLRELFAAAQGVMAARRLLELVARGIPRNLHDQAWDVADACVFRMRASQ